MKWFMTVNLILCGLHGVAVGQETKKQAKVVVAVIDTGIDPVLMSKPWICKTGHKDFSGVGDLKDRNDHGTHIAGLIEQYAKNVIISDRDSLKKLDESQEDFCIIVLKFYDPKGPNDPLKASIKAVEWAIKQKVDIINYSAGGTEKDTREKLVWDLAISLGITTVVAAGNEKSNIDKKPYYPAMYNSKSMFIVGNLENEVTRRIASSSNYGKSVNAWEKGVNVMSRVPGGFGMMTGTSQATAIKTGKIVRQKLHSK